MFVYLRFLYIFTPSMFAVHKFRVKKSAVKILLLHSVEENRSGVLLNMCMSRVIG